MKVYVLFFALLLWGASIDAQCPTYLTLSTQGEVDSFSIHYPNCTTLENITIEGSGITHLDGLSALQKVSWDLWIQDCGITDLHGLENLDSIGELKLFRTPVTSLGALSNLKKVGSVRIGGCDSLTSLAGLTMTSLKHLGIGVNHDVMEDTVFTYPNASLVDFSGLESLESIEELEVIGGHIQSFNGLQNVKKIGSILIAGSQITDFQGLTHLTQVDDIILGFPFHHFLGFYEELRPFGTQITSFHGLEAITHLNSLELMNCHQLTNFSGLEGLVHISDHLYVGRDEEYQYTDSPPPDGYTTEHFGNDQISSFSGLNNLEKIDGTLAVRNGTAFGDCSGLDQLKSVNRISIYSSQMDSLGGLNSLESLHELYLSGNFKNLAGINLVDTVDNVYVRNMPDFQSDLSGLATFSVIKEKLFMSRIHGVASFSGLAGIPKIGDLIVWDMDDLVSVSGIEASQDIHYLELVRNQSLKNLDGLTVFDTIPFLGIGNYAPQCPGCPPVAIGNDSLVDISGIENVGISKITIAGNHQLPVCAYYPVCLAIEHGDATIISNASGCNTIEEVADSCGIIGTNDVSVLKVKVYPNPATDRITIFSSENRSISQVYIYNQLGQMVLQSAEKEIDVSVLPKGLYLLKIEGRDGIREMKLVKD